MAKLLLPGVHSYQGWKSLLDERNTEVLKIGNNTTLQRLVFPETVNERCRRCLLSSEVHRGCIAIRLHQTNVVTFFDDNCVQLYTGGFYTVTTKDRMNQALPPQYRVFSKDYDWFLSRRPDYHTEETQVVPFRDSMIFQLHRDLPGWHEQNKEHFISLKGQ